MILVFFYYFTYQVLVAETSFDFLFRIFFITSFKCVSLVIFLKLTLALNFSPYFLRRLHIYLNTADQVNYRCNLNFKQTSSKLRFYIVLR